jgi:gamma-glutamyltranspeptidase / glutathione hydrolase
MYFRSLLVPTLALAAVASCASAPAGADPGSAGAADLVVSPADAGRRLVARNAAVTSASPLASDAGLAMLRAGGNAIDAAVATAFALGVVEPQMSGLGGSGALLIWRQAEGAADYLDFYAMQNAASFLAQPAVPAAVSGGEVDMRIVGVPGQVAGLLAAHSRYGRLSREQVLAPAIRLADDGFAVGQVLAQFIHSDSAKLHRFADARRSMWPDGRPLQPGALLRNPELAATLRLIAQFGAAGFYEGEVARAIVAAMNAGGHPVSLADLAAYAPEWKRPLCTTYRGRVVLSAPPPQTGAQVLQTLKLLEPHDLRAAGLPTRSPRAFDILVSALRVAQADNRGNDDPRWVDVPVAGRLSDGFARERQPFVGSGTATVVAPLDPRAFSDAAPAPACAPLAPWRAASAPPADATTRVGATQTAQAAPAAPAELPGDEHGETTHISVVDAEGNAVALTQTNSTTFGIGARVAGFFLNDSGFRFTSPGDASAEVVAGTDAASGTARWRTRTSTIAPTIVLDGGAVLLVTGAPGAGRIPTEIVQTMVYVLDYGMDPLHALRMPRIFPAAANTVVQLEHGFTAELLQAIRAMGYEPAAQSSSYARLYMIVRDRGRWIAVADPRHDGEPRGY